MKSAAVDSEELKGWCHQILDQEKVSREHLALSPAQTCGAPAEHSRTDDLLPLRKVHGDRCHTFPGHLLLPGQLVCFSWGPGQRSLVSYSPWGHKELDTTKRLTLSFVENKSFQGIAFGWREFLEVIHCCCCSGSQSYAPLCDPMDCSMPGFPIRQNLLESAQTLGHWVNDAMSHGKALTQGEPRSLQGLALRGICI